MNKEFPFLIYNANNENISINTLIKDELYGLHRQQWQNCLK